MSIEGSDGLMEEVGTQVLTSAAYQAPDAVLQAIEAVSQDAVVQVGSY